MSVDFPRAWEIARSVPVSNHDQRCSYAQALGGFLCDCSVLTEHPEYLDDVLQTTDGVPFERSEKGVGLVGLLVGEGRAYDEPTRAEAEFVETAGPLLLEAHEQKIRAEAIAVRDEQVVAALVEQWDRCIRQGEPLDTCRNLVAALGLAEPFAARLRARAGESERRKGGVDG